MKDYVKAMNIQSPFKDGVPGDKWIREFSRRWRHRIPERTVQNLTTARAKGISQEIVDGYFELLERKMKELNINGDRTRIFNCDETGLTTNPKSSRFFVKKGALAQQLTPSEGKTMYTVLFACNATGDFVPPYIIYKGTATQLHDTWVTGGPDDAAYNTTKSGWMEDYAFKAWLSDVFCPFILVRNVKTPVLLIFDGHNSHITYSMLQVAKERGVEIVCMPAHTSHVFQPLDVAVYHPLKVVWRELLHKHNRETRHLAIGKPSFPILLNQLFKAICAKPENVLAGFRKCGLVPLDKEAIPKAAITLASQFALPSMPRPTAPLSLPSTSQDPQPSSSFVVPISPNPSPRKQWHKILVENITPPPSELTKRIMAQQKAPRHRIQKKFGECLTETEAMDRIKQGEEKRMKLQENKSKKGSKKNIKEIKQSTGSVLATKLQRSLGLVDMELEKSSVRSPPERDNFCDIFDSSDDDCTLNEFMLRDPTIFLKEADVDFFKTLPQAKFKETFLACTYSSRWYLGNPIKVMRDTGDIEVKFLTPAGPRIMFTWPEKDDICLVPVSNILGVMQKNPVRTKGSRPSFQIGENTMDAIDKIHADHLDFAN